jgi:hypothetical protein
MGVTGLPPIIGSLPERDDCEAGTAMGKEREESELRDEDDDVVGCGVLVTHCCKRPNDHHVDCQLQQVFAMHWG